MSHHSQEKEARLDGATAKPPPTGVTSLATKFVRTTFDETGRAQCASSVLQPAKAAAAPVKLSAKDRNSLREAAKATAVPINDRIAEARVSNAPQSELTAGEEDAPTTSISGVTRSVEVAGVSTDTKITPLKSTPNRKRSYEESGCEDPAAVECNAGVHSSSTSQGLVHKSSDQKGVQRPQISATHFEITSLSVPTIADASSLPSETTSGANHDATDQRGDAPSSKSIDDEQRKLDDQRSGGTALSGPHSEKDVSEYGPSSKPHGVKRRADSDTERDDGAAHVQQRNLGNADRPPPAQHLPAEEPGQKFRNAIRPRPSEKEAEDQANLLKTSLPSKQPNPKKHAGASNAKRNSGNVSGHQSNGAPSRTSNAQSSRSNASQSRCPGGALTEGPISGRVSKPASMRPTPTSKPAEDEVRRALRTLEAHNDSAEQSSDILYDALREAKEKSALALQDTGMKSVFELTPGYVGREIFRYVWARHVRDDDRRSIDKHTEVTPEGNIYSGLHAFLSLGSWISGDRGLKPLLLTTGSGDAYKWLKPKHKDTHVVLVDTTKPRPEGLPREIPVLSVENMGPAIAVCDLTEVHTIRTGSLDPFRRLHPRDTAHLTVMREDLAHREIAEQNELQIDHMYRQYGENAHYHIRELDRLRKEKRQGFNRQAKSQKAFEKVARPKGPKGGKGGPKRAY